MHATRLRKHGDVNIVKAPRHGLSYLPEFNVWRAIKTRCNNKNFKSYDNYGGRGIKICKQWEDSFVEFYKYVGARPSNKHSIDRIDNNKGYEPGNVRWATANIQATNNRRNTEHANIKIKKYKTKTSYTVSIRKDKKLLFYKRFNDFNSALLARDTVRASF